MDGIGENGEVMISAWRGGSKREVHSSYSHHPFFRKAARAAASLATGTRKGEQET